MRAILLLAAGFLCPLVAFGQDVVAVAKKVRPTVVLVEVMDAKGAVMSTGTGFFVTADGLIATNAHVIKGGTSFRVRREDGAIFEVVGVVQTSTSVDLAIIKAKCSGVAFLDLNRLKAAEVGERVVVVGSPLGLEGTVSDGIVSATRTLDGEGQLIQITAPVSPGSSGSPVTDLQGDLVGVATLASSGKAQSLNFAVPAEQVRKMWEQIGRDGAVIAKSPPRLESSTGPDFTAVLEAYSKADYARALSLLKPLAVDFPDSSRVHLMLAATYERIGFNEDAIREYRQSIKLEPTYSNAWQGLGHIYLKQNLLPNAKQCFQEAIKQKPDSSEPWISLSVVHIFQDAFPEALAALRQGLRAEPNYFDSEPRRLEGISGILARKPQTESVRAMLQLLAQSGPVRRAAPVAPASPPSPPTITRQTREKTLLAHAILRGTVRGTSARVVQLYSEAANEGDTDAMVNLGHLYRYGKLVPKDIGRARLLYNRAAALGNPEASESLLQLQQR